MTFILTFISCVWLKIVLMKIDDGEREYFADIFNLNYLVVYLSVGVDTAYVTILMNIIMRCCNFILFSYFF